MSDESLDPQGLPNREQLRQNRLETYNRFMHRGMPDVELDSLKDQISIPASDKEGYLDFSLFETTDYVSVEHNQLRNCIGMACNSSLIYTHNNQIKEFNILTKKRNILVDLKKENQTTKISCLATCPNFLIAGGIAGELIVKSLKYGKDSSITCKYLTQDPNGITNNLSLVLSKSGAQTVICSSNDEMIRIIDVNILDKVLLKISMPWAPNCSAVSPNQNLFLSVGDSDNALIKSTDTGKTIHTLTGHRDHSFACCWSPCGRYVVTGSQDLTARLYDMRNLSEAFCVLPSKMGPFRSMSFDPTGTFLALNEQADFVQIYDPKRLDRCQLIDFFGEVAGCAWNASGSKLYIGVADSKIGGIFEYKRTKDDENLDYW